MHERRWKDFIPSPSDILVTILVVVAVVAGLKVSLDILSSNSTPDPVSLEGSHTPGAPTDSTAGPETSSPTSTSSPGASTGVVPPSLMTTVERMAAQMRCQTLVTSEPLTAVTYNIKSGRAGGLPRLLGVMRRTDAEVFLLQEVDNHRRSTGNVDQAGWFASQLGGWHYAFGRNVTFGDGLYGTAVVSKYPILSWTNTPLPNINHSQPRGLLHVVINFHGTKVSIYDTHLDNTSGANRLQQAARISQIMAADPNPKILGGDMNTWPGSAPDRVLASRLNDTWNVAGSGKGATHPAGHPRTRIDFLMYGGPGLRATSAVVLPDTASDHLAVRAQYELSGIKTVKCTRRQE